MSAQLNRYLLEQTRYDSGSLTQSGFVVHQYTMPGRYKVDVFRKEGLVRTLSLDVTEESKEQQQSIDLAGVETMLKSDCDCNRIAAQTTLLAKDGYALFYVGSGSGNFSVKSYLLGENEPRLVFDSAHLDKGDLFGITLIRPASYVLISSATKARLAITVEPVKIGTTRYVPPDAVMIGADQIGSMKEGIRLQQAQGLVVRASGGDRFIIEGASDTPSVAESPKRIARWTKFSAKRNK